MKRAACAVCSENREVCSQPSIDLYVDGQGIIDVLTHAPVNGHEEQGAEVPPSGHLVEGRRRRKELDTRGIIRSRTSRKTIGHLFRI